MGRTAKGSRLAVRPFFVLIACSASVYVFLDAAHASKSEPAYEVDGDPRHHK